MSRRFNSKRLLVVLSGLAIVLLITFLTKIPSEKATLKKTVASFDTAAVEHIFIKPRASEGEEFEFFREGGVWKVRQGNVTAAPREGAVANILNDLYAVKPSALVAVSRSKWQEFDVTDSLGIRIRAENGKGRKLADVVVGRFSYKAEGNPSGGYGGGSIVGTSYIRQYDEEAVYAVDGFLTFSFSGSFDDWRNRELLRFSSEDVTMVTFDFPADSGFVLEKKDNKWFSGNHPADSALTAEYLGTAGHTDGEIFADSFKPGGSSLYQVTFEGNNLLDVTLKFYADEKGNIYLNSSRNPEVYFRDESGNLKRQILKSSGNFIITREQPG